MSGVKWFLRSDIKAATGHRKIPTAYEHLPIFVYGTLQQGEARHNQWPRHALRIEPAATQGRLYDLGPYPGLVEGNDTVQGELWYVRADDLAATLERLDKIEGYAQGGIDRYLRRVTNCVRPDGDVVKAYAYFFNRLDYFPDAQLVTPDSRDVCEWRQATESL